MTKEVRVRDVKKGDTVTIGHFTGGKRHEITGKVKKINKVSDLGGIDNDRILQSLELVIDTSKMKKRVPGVGREFVWSADPKENVTVEGLSAMNEKKYSLLETLTEAKNPKTKIGRHTVEILDFGKLRTPFGGNNTAEIKFDGKNYEVFKQGMINIWAFPKRPTLSRQEEDEFDEFMDANLGKKR